MLRDSSTPRFQYQTQIKNELQEKKKEEHRFL
jgi:hypothetical protein